MKSDKQWKNWNEFFKCNPDLLVRENLEQKSSGELKHLPISMTKYYVPSWSGWHDFLSKTDK